MQTAIFINILVIAAAILGGALVSAQGMINGRLNQIVGSPIQAALISFSVGWVCLLAAGFATGAGLPSMSRLSQAPWWAFLGGLAGAYMVSSTAFGVPRIGSTAWKAALLAGQMAAAVLLDHFGAFGQASRPVTPEKLVGIAALFGGVWLIQR